METMPGCCGVKVFMGSSTGSLLIEDGRITDRRQRASAAALSTVLSTPTGRRVVWDVIVSTGMFESVFNASGSIVYSNSGRRDVGLTLKRRVINEAGIDTKAASPRKVFRNVCVDCITHDPDSLALADSVFGETQIVFGSDWPFSMGLPDPHKQLADTDGSLRTFEYKINDEKVLEALAAL